MGIVVYTLCAITSIICAAVLLKSYKEGGGGLLLWCSLCFISLALNNIILFFDLVVTGPEVDLSIWRNSVTIFGFASLLYGLIWETV